MRIASLALALLLLACGPGTSTGGPAAPAPAAPAPAPGQNPVPATAAPREPVKFLHSLASIDLGFLPALVAASPGFGDAEGLDIELLQMPSNAAIPAITNKQVHLAAGGSGVRAAYQGAPLRGIFYYYQQNIFHAVAAPDVRSYRDLSGKVVGVASPGSTEDQVVKLLLRREGLAPTDVQSIVLGSGPQRVQAMLAGQVHFTVVNPDLAVDLERKGFNRLGSLGDLLPVPFSGFVAHQDTIRDQPELLRAWMRASIRALRFIKSNPAEAAEVGVQRGLEREVARRAVELMLPAISDDDPGGVTEAGLLLVTQTDLAALEMDADPAELGKRVNDLALLRQVQWEMGIRCTTGYQC
jgi:NitT/TauT family transport system substrate-binding protein